MKKLSLMLLFFFSCFLMISSSVVSQETTADSKKPTTEVITSEDKPVEKTEKVFEKEEVVSLKAKAKTYNDGFNIYVNNKVSFKLFDMDNILKDSVYYSIDGKENKKYTEPFTLSEEGNRTITYYSVDRMGNTEGKKSFSVIVDVTAPAVELSITAPFVKTNDVIYVSEKFSYTYSIASKDNLSGVSTTSYIAPGEDQKEYFKPFTIISDKPAALSVFSEDKVGNVTDKYSTKIFDRSGALISESIENLKVVVDKTAPAVEIKADKDFIKKNALNIASKDYKYLITASDSESGVGAIYYRINSKNDFIIYTGEITFNTNGLHKIEAFAKDKVGNTSKTAVIEVFVDTIPAETQIKMITE